MQSVFFFVALRWAPRPFGGARAKKKTPPRVFFLLRPRVFFFALAPCRRPTGLLLPLPFAGAAAKIKIKKTPWVVFFFLLLAPRRHGASPSPAFPRGRSKKKKTPWVVFFFLLRPCADAHSLTAGLGGDASPSPGCFFFAAAPPAPGWCFFFAVAPPGRSLTHCGLGRFRQGPGGVFFLLRPRRVFLDNNKKCLGYYIGSKKTRRGHSKKKNTTSGLSRFP